MHRALFSWLRNGVLLLAVVDFLRFQGVVRQPLLRWRWTLLTTALAAAAGAALAAISAGASATSILNLATLIALQSVVAIVLFFAGCIWALRLHQPAAPVRQELLWARRLAGTGDYAHPQTLRRRVFYAVVLGVLFAGFSMLFVSGYSFIFDPEYARNAAQDLQAGQPKIVLVYQALLAPLFEELTFRWYLFLRLSYLLRGWAAGRWLAVVLSAAVWALGHAYGDPVWVKETQIIVIGLTLAGLFPYLGLEGCIIAHLVLNVTSMLLAL